MRTIVSICLVLMAATLATAGVVQHVPTHISSWRGSWNPTWHGWLDGWPNDGADGTFAEFDRAALQAAIDAAIATYGAWDAKVIVTQVDWVDDQPPLDTDPVVVSVDIDPQTLLWGSSYAYNAGSGNWRYAGNNYSSLVAAINAGVAAGDSMIVDDAPWQAVWKPAGVDPFPSADYWDIIIDVPESLITAYLNNPSADGLFVSGKLTGGAYVQVFGYDQWGGAADIRVEITAPPPGPWIVLDPVSLSFMVHLGNPVADPQQVTVNNAGTGSLSWTAVESPDRTWLSLQNSSGGNGQAFTVLVDATGLSPGSYDAEVVVSDPAANNSPQSLPISLSVFQTEAPLIELVPDSLTVQVRASDPPPAATPVTVNNVGFGSLSWTATVQGTPTWLSLTNATGSDGDAFLVHIDHTSLQPGAYAATVQVVDPAASNSPQLLPINLEVRDQDADITIANSYDDAWETGPDGWITYARTLQQSWSGTTGFVVHLGDSITYANPYGQWARYGSGKTPDDVAITNWMHSGTWGDGTNYSDNGWYLAAYDVPGRGGSFTAKGGITTSQYLNGTYLLPSTDEMFTAGFTNPDGKQYRDAQIAIIMLGTNDASQNRSTSAMIADLEAITDKVLANGTIVVLSTIPPKRNDQADVDSYNAAIRSLAQSKKLPLIDFYQEILRRRPGNTWDGTLISGDGVHPSASGNGYDSSSDPYANNGQALSEVGYLLRGWLSVQKVKEIKQKVIDLPPEPPAAPSNAQAQASLATRLELTWQDNANNETGFQIERKIDNGPWEPLAQTPANTQAYTDDTVMPRTTYTYRVAAYNDAGSSSWAQTGSVTTPTCPPALLERDGLVVVEAESYDDKTDGSAPVDDIWSLQTGQGSVGAGFMAAGPDNGDAVDGAGTIEAISPRLSYRIYFANAGTYYLWLRAQGLDGASDSAHFGLDGTSISSDRYSAATLLRTGQFEWRSLRGDSTRPTIVVPNPGLHSLDIWMREDGGMIDRLLITTSSAYTPTGTGPAESQRCPRIPGDIDEDGDTDVTDFGFFADAMLGPGLTTTNPLADLDGDDDCDLADFAIFAANFTGPL